MSAPRAGVVAVLILTALPWTTAAAQSDAPAGTPPQVLTIVHVRLKPRSAAAYGAAEAQVVRAFERDKIKMYWIGLQGAKDPGDVLYLDLFDTPDARERAAAIYRDAAKKHPELSELQGRLDRLTASHSSTLTRRRDDVDRTPRGVDFATMRWMRLTTFQVVAGREGEFLNAIRTTNPKEGAWLVYEADDSSTYALLTLSRRAIGRRDGPAIPRPLRQHRGVYTRVDTRIYAVRPAWTKLS